MNYIYNYENPMQQCENLVKSNFDKLKFLKDQNSSSPKFSAMERAYTIFNKYLNEAKKNITSLKSKYSILTKRYEILLETNFAKEFLNYLVRQEVLRLKFLEIINECKRINACIDEILQVSGIEAEKRNSIQNPSERLCGRATQNQVNVNVKSDSSASSSTVLEKSTSSARVSESFKSLSSPVLDGSIIGKKKSSTMPLEIKNEKVKPLVPSKQNEAANPGIVYTCDICGETTKYRQNMERHEMLHEGLKPFICAECGKSFPRKDTMKNHILIVHFPHQKTHNHNDNHRHQRKNNSFCDKKRRRSSNLNSPQFSCMVCGRLFANQGCKKRHERLVHLEI